MLCQIEFSLLSETIAGLAPDNWPYEVEAKVFSDGLMTAGTVAIGDHPLKPGPPQPVNGDSGKVVLLAKPRDGTARVEISVKAPGVAWDDAAAPAAVMLPIRCPELGCPAYTIEADISLGIADAPGFTSGRAKFTVRARLVASRVPELVEAGEFA